MSTLRKALKEYKAHRGELEKLMDEIHHKYHKSKKAIFLSRKAINLKWELGVGVVYKLKENVTCYSHGDDYSSITLMGYPVDINYNNPDVIKLWLEV